MQQWVNYDKTLICLVAPCDKVLPQPAAHAAFYDSDLGFFTARAYRPIEEEAGRVHFGHLRLA